jgi:hypothetical protein
MYVNQTVEKKFTEARRFRKIINSYSNFQEVYNRTNFSFFNITQLSNRVRGSSVKTELDPISNIVY